MFRYHVYNDIDNDLHVSKVSLYGLHNYTLIHVNGGSTVLCVKSCKHFLGSLFMHLKKKLTTYSEIAMSVY